jgi:hypothetical protein
VRPPINRATVLFDRLVLDIDVIFCGAGRTDTSSSLYATICYALACDGYLQVVVEFARNILGMVDAQYR